MVQLASLLFHKATNVDADQVTQAGETTRNCQLGTKNTTEFNTNK